MKIFICPDTFKESISALNAGAVIADTFMTVSKKKNIDLVVDVCPVADGGEGSMLALAGTLGGEIRSIEVTGPYGTPVRARYLLCGTDAYIESAEASGLALSKRRECKYATTYGTGELMADAAARGAKRIVVFAGGSATCDGGIGMAEALGYGFYDKGGIKLESVGDSMAKISKIRPPKRDILFGVEVICASDVTIPLYGELGAAYVFAPQKGATVSDIRALDRGLEHLAKVIMRDLHKDIRDFPGAGAAGGLGGGLVAFCSARICGGFELISSVLSLKEKISESDLVITGEGCTDRQSMMGKVVGKIADMCRTCGVQMAVISGKVKDMEELRMLDFIHAYECVRYAPSDDESIKNPVPYLKRAAEAAAEELIV